MAIGPLVRAVAIAVLLLLGGTPASVAAEAFGILTVEELEALAALRYNKATEQQQALLFMRNDAINRAALRGHITDDLYQAAQREYAATNQHFAQQAAREAGAEFRVQTASSATYSPGTDSDYITKVDRPEQITRMQEGYNRRINQYLGQNGVDVRRSDWHVRLDTDFMADPGRVSEAQFREIAKLNNDAYKRRAAAVYEAVSRAGDGTRVTPEQFTAYAEEMRDFVAKKQRLLDQMRRDPRLLTSEPFQAELQRMMAQEQKYISRIEGSNALLRQQQGLRPIQSLDDAAMWSLRQADDGTWRLVRDPTLAKLGSVRAPDAFRTTAAANALAQNSLENALERLAQSFGEAGVRNPAFARRAAGDIAAVLSDLPPSRKGAFLDQLRRTHGEAFTREVAQAMRDQHRQAVRSASGVRAWAGRMLQALRTAGIAWDLYEAGSALKEYVEALNAAMDPNLTDEEAAALFEKAQAAGARMALIGGLGALFEAYPPLAAAMGSFVISFYGTRAILENTETGEKIDLAVTDFFDRHIRAGERATCAVKEFFGYESECERLRQVDQKLLERVLAALREDRWQLAEGVTMRDIIEAIRAGDFAKISGEMLVDSEAWQAAEATTEALEARLEELAARCGGALPTEPARAGAGGAPAESDQKAEALRSCRQAATAGTGLQVKADAVRQLSQRALDGFRTAEAAIDQCTGLAALDRGFATAQTASSNAADAARAFADLMGTLPAAEDRIVQARADAEQAITAANETDEACTGDINALIDAAAAAHAGVEWDRFRSRFDAIQDAAVGIAEARGASGAVERAELSRCANLGDPFDQQLAAMEAILTLDGVPARRSRIEAAAQTCRDELDAAAPPPPPAVAAAPPMSTGPGSPGGGVADPAALRSCLCGCYYTGGEMSWAYDTEDRGWSPSCRDLSNGPCIGRGFGCTRRPLPTSGQCRADCAAKFGG